MKSKDKAKEPTERAIREARRIVGRINGRKGGLARSAVLSEERRSEIGRMGAMAKNAKFKGKGEGEK